MCARWLGDGGEQLVPFGELPGVQIELLDDFVSGVAKRAGSSRVGEEFCDRVTEAAPVGRIDQQATVLVSNLVTMAADIAGDDRPSLPQRFGNSKPEALLEALLDDHVGVTLERVYDRGILLDVVHRQACDGHPCALLVTQCAPGRLHLIERFGLLGVVSDRMDGRSGEDEMSLNVGERVLDEAAHHTNRVLDAIPAAGV